MNLYAALDQSTTSTKCALFTSDGKQIFTYLCPHAQITPEQGYLEHDPMEILNNVQTCMNMGKASLKDGDNILTLGITNQRETTVAWNKHTGVPYMNAIVWSDVRTINICKQLIEKYGKQYFQQRTGLPINTYFSSYKIRWMMDTCPKLVNEIDDVLFGTIDTWLLWNLTGNYVTDVTNASRTNLMNLTTLDWDDDILKIFGIPRASLPKIMSSGGLFGIIKAGSFSGIQVNAVLGDQQAASIGHGLFNEGDSKSTYGSGLFILANIGNTPRISEHGLLTTVLYQKLNEKPVYAFEGAVESGGQLLNWAKDKQGWFGSWEELSESVQVDNGGVYMIPAFSGLFTPYWNENATGTLIGLSYHTNRKHIQRAILECICYRTRDVIEAMESSGIHIHSLNVDGGLTNNIQLMQLQADIIARTLKQPEVTDSTCLGVAMFAGLSIGNLNEQTIRSSIHISKEYKGERQYDQEYKQWKKAIECALLFMRV